MASVLLDLSFPVFQARFQALHFDYDSAYGKK
jgi:hypothetical protein